MSSSYFRILSTIPSPTYSFLYIFLRTPLLILLFAIPSHSLPPSFSSCQLVDISAPCTSSCSFDNNKFSVGQFNFCRNGNKLKFHTWSLNSFVTNGTCPNERGSRRPHTSRSVTDKSTIEEDDLVLKMKKPGKEEGERGEMQSLREKRDSVEDWVMMTRRTTTTTNKRANVWRWGAFDAFEGRKELPVSN